MGKWDKLVPYLVLGTIAIIFFISLILIIQMVKSSQAQAWDKLLEAGRLAQSMSGNIIASTAP